MPFEMDSTISIHAPPARGATASRDPAPSCHTISIHAPCEGGDRSVVNYFCRMQISIHAPREGGDRRS